MTDLPVNHTTCLDNWNSSRFSLHTKSRNRVSVSSSFSGETVLESTKMRTMPVMQHPHYFILASQAGFGNIPPPSHLNIKLIITKLAPAHLSPWSFDLVARALLSLACSVYLHRAKALGPNARWCPGPWAFSWSWSSSEHYEAAQSCSLHLLCPALRAYADCRTPLICTKLKRARGCAPTSLDQTLKTWLRTSTWNSIL